MKRELLTCRDDECAIHRARLREYEWLLGPEPESLLLDPFKESLDKPSTRGAPSDPMEFDTPEDRNTWGGRHRPSGDDEWQ